jgi:plastocyanin
MSLTIRRTALVLLASTAIVAPTAAVASIGGMSASHASKAQTAGSHTVVLQSLRFHPGTLTINRGESVTWVWRDGNVAHNVTGPGFHSRTQSHGSFTVRFTHSGTFNYKCTIHASVGMVGKIIVR